MADINVSIIDQQVRKLVEDLEPPLQGDEPKQRSTAFVLLCVKTLLDLGMEEAIDCMTDGGQDAGIDAMHVGSILDGEFCITLLQGKYKQRLDGASAFPASDIGKLVNTVGILFDPDKPFHAHRGLAARVEEIRSLIRDGNLPRVRIVLCNNGKPWSDDGQAAIDSAGFPEERVTWEHLGPERLISLMQSQSAVNDELKLVGKITVEEFNFRRVLVGKVAVTELASLFERHGDRLLEKNIRRYLGYGVNWVNRHIGHTLRSVDERPNFYFFNNGVTVVCSKFRYNALQGENHVVKLENLQVINGGQTCHTIRRVVKALPDGDFSQAFVLLRLYELEDDDSQRDLIRDITYATNSQNPVDLRDLRANDPVQQRLEMGLADMGVTYLRKRSDRRKAESSIDPALAAEAVLAVWRHKPHLARFDKNQHFGRMYREIFRDDLSPAQVIVAVDILREVERRRKDASEDAPRFLPYASHFLAMLVGDQILERMVIELDGLTHVTLPRARQELERFDELYRRALPRLRILLHFLGIDETASSLQKLSATFRRSDLLELLPDLEAEATRRIERMKKEREELASRAEKTAKTLRAKKTTSDRIMGDLLRFLVNLGVPEYDQEFITWTRQAYGEPD